jgi:PAS domain-containing protein
MSGLGLQIDLHHQSSLAARHSPTAFLQDIIYQRNPKGAIASLVSYLSRPGYSIVDLLSDVALFKESIATKEPIGQAIGHWKLLDGAVGECLAQTTLSHEKFIESTLHAFCYYDQAGIIVSANSRMLDLNPDCVGRHVAGYFGKMEAEVRLALAGAPRRLYQLDLCSRRGPVPVLAEFGKIESTAGKGGGYALFVDMTDLVEAEHRALEAAPYGMLKLDAKHRILYATEKVAALLESSPDELIGRDARRVITDIRDQGSRTKVVREGIQRRKGRGGEYDIVLTKPKSGKRTNIKVMSIPLFDAGGSFSGSIERLQPTDIIVARESISRLIATEPAYRLLFDEIVDVVKQFIDFDWAYLFLYSPGREYSRVICRSGPPIAFQSRWFPVLEQHRDFLNRPQTWVDDLAEFDPEAFADQPDMQTALEAGMKAMISIPVREGGQIIGGFSLTSTKAATYNLQTREALERLMLEQVLLTLFHALRREEDDFVNGLVKEISGIENLEMLAAKVVGELATFYQFQNVSIFKVNALRGHFRLLAQKLGPGGGTPMPEGYTQEIDKGMLGLCYERRDYAILKDSNGDSDEAKRYIRVAPEVRSELCVPIRLFQRILWILNVEDHRTDAFTFIEVEALRRVIQQIQGTLERIFQNAVLVQVLDVCPGAVVVTDQKYGILRCNSAARQLTQRDSLSVADDFSRFFDLPLESFSSRPSLATVRGAAGEETQVLVSRLTLDDEYDHVVFMLQNVSELQWDADFERLKAALAETTAQVRVPVSLLSSYVHQLARKVQDENLQDLARKAIRQLGRIELTYDRVLSSYDAQSLPERKSTTLDVKSALEHIVSELPRSDQGIISLPCEVHGTVEADPYRVLFALTSMLAYLLRSRTDSTPIAIRTRRLKGVLKITMTGTAPARPTAQGLAALVEATRAEIALGQDLLNRIAKEAGGSFEIAPRRNGREQLCLRLVSRDMKE